MLEITEDTVLNSRTDVKKGTMDRLKSKFLGSLVGTAVGDSLGAGDGIYTDDTAMMIAPIGLFYYDNPKKLRKIACQSSKITHTHVLAIEGALLQAYAVALATNAKPGRLDNYGFLGRLGGCIEANIYREKLKFMEALLKEAANQSKVIVELGNTVESFNSVPISVYSFLANSDFQNTLNYALSLGGDRDTITAMTGAIAGAHYGIENIPKEWTDSLENRDYIEDLAEKLWQIKKGKMINESNGSQEDCTG